jgi:predicted acyltransferase
MQQRNQTLDALRGYAILTMVLSGSVAFGDTLPAWMYHAQVPPPLHQFVPTLAGITWVDLVFPFFLFTMGAAIPLALQKNIVAKTSFVQILFIAFRRFFLLAFFALFTHHLMPWVLSKEPTAWHFLLSIVAFILVFFQLYDNKSEKYKQLFLGLKFISLAIAVALLYSLPFKDGTGFSFTNSDIIIIVLANMAFFGTIIWWATRNNQLLRIGILPFIIAIFLAAKEPNEGWAKLFYNFNEVAGYKFDWLYKFYFLKYLFIIIPGTLAGEYFLRFARRDITKVEENSKGILKLIAALAFGLVVINTILLFERYLFLNLSLSTVIIITIYFSMKKLIKENNQLLFHFFTAGAYLLLLGLFFEAYEGGIKKDSSTYSYYFVTSGLAFFMLIGFSGLALGKIGSTFNNYLSLNGRNPMVAYIAGNLLLQPILHLTGANLLFDSMNVNPILGFLKGVLFTGIVSLITILFTKKRWFWKS